MKKKLLISAYSCSPRNSSEPGVGWNFVVELARYYDVAVVISRTYEELNEGIDIPSNVKIYYCAVCVPEKYQHNSNLFLRQYMYNNWQKRLSKYILSEQIEFDYLYHITFVRYSSPSSLFKLNAPLVFGPVGGGETAPASFYKNHGLKSQLIEKLRLFTMHLARKGYSKKCMKSASLVISTTEQTKEKITEIRGKSDTIVEQAIGLSQKELEALADNAIDKSFKQGGKFRILAIGRLIYWKGFDLLLEALKSPALAGLDIDLSIVGDGPYRQNLESQAGDLVSEGRVKFRNNIPRSEVFKLYKEADCFCLPSLHDSGGFVHLEALASGLPVICLDTGGPSVIVNDHCGVKVPVTTPEEVVSGLIDAILRLFHSNETCEDMSKEGLNRAKEFEWSAKIDRIVGHMHKAGLE